MYVSLSPWQRFTYGGSHVLPMQKTSIGAHGPRSLRGLTNYCGSSLLPVSVKNHSFGEE